VVVAKNLHGVDVFDRGLLKFTSTSAANCTWSAFVTQFIRNTAIIANKVFSLYLCNQRSNIAKNTHCTPLSSHNAKHQQRACILAAPPSGQRTLVSGR